MALEQKLSLKLSQRLVMTPSLQQAIKLLQMTRMELETVVAQELEGQRSLRPGLRGFRGRVRRLEAGSLGGGVGVAALGALGHAQVVAGRLRPHVGPFAVVGQHLPEVRQAIGIEGFDGLGDPVMEALAAPRRQLVVRDFADPIVREVEALAHPSQEAPAHELLHARRHDWLFLLFEELLKAVLFFHPAVHWLVGRIRLAREQAVDAAVVRRLGGREAYLASLVEVARISVRARALPAAPFLGKSHLRERVDLLLKEVVMSRSRTRIHAAASAGALVLAAAWAVSAAPLHSAPSAVPASTASREDEARAGVPQIVHKVNPIYPESAKAEKVEGTFQVAIVVGKDGAVRDARVVASSSTPGRLEDKTALGGDARLGEAAVAAVKQWRYQPIEKNGKPVEAQMTVTIVFRL